MLRRWIFVSQTNLERVVTVIVIRGLQWLIHIRVSQSQLFYPTRSVFIVQSFSGPSLQRSQTYRLQFIVALTISKLV